MYKNQYRTLVDVHLELVRQGITCSYSSVVHVAEDLGLSRKRASKIWRPPTKDDTACPIQNETRIKKCLRVVDDVLSRIQALGNKIVSAFQQHEKGCCGAEHQYCIIEPMVAIIYIRQSSSQTMQQKTTKNVRGN